MPKAKKTAAKQLASRVASLERELARTRRRCAAALALAAGSVGGLVVACQNKPPPPLKQVKLGGVSLDEGGLRVTGADGASVLVTPAGLLVQNSTTTSSVTPIGFSVRAGDKAGGTLQLALNGDLGPALELRRGDAKVTAEIMWDAKQARAIASRIGVRASAPPPSGAAGSDAKPFELEGELQANAELSYAQLKTEVRRGETDPAAGFQTYNRAYLSVHTDAADVTATTEEHHKEHAKQLK